MPRTRKMRDWKVTVKGKTVRVQSKTYGGACHKAFKKLHIGKPMSTREGGYQDVQVELLPLHHREFVKG